MLGDFYLFEGQLLEIFPILSKHLQLLSFHLSITKCHSQIFHSPQKALGGL